MFLLDQLYHRLNRSMDKNLFFFNKLNNKFGASSTDNFKIKKLTAKSFLSSNFLIKNLRKFEQNKSRFSTIEQIRIIIHNEEFDNNKQASSYLFSNINFDQLMIN